MRCVIAFVLGAALGIAFNEWATLEAYRAVVKSRPKVLGSPSLSD